MRNYDRTKVVAIGMEENVHSEIFMFGERKILMEVPDFFSEWDERYCRVRHKEGPVWRRIILVLAVLCFRDPWNMRWRNPLMLGSCIDGFDNCQKGQH